MTVEVRYLGHLGNNLFEYALGRILAEELGLALRCLPARDAPGWGQVERMSGIVDRLSAWSDRIVDAPQILAGEQGAGPQLRYVLGEKSGWTGHGINLDYLLRHGQGRHIVLHGYFQRTEYYHPYRERIRRWYRFRDTTPAVTLQPQDVVVHLRQSLDMFLLDRAIDLNFYRELLGGMPRLGHVYVCGLGLDDRVRAALAPFRPIYLDLPAIDTLSLMTQAKRIVLANSTFSWWGAYLSDADEIYYPRVVRNFWSKDRSDVDLEVPEDRYNYIDDVAVQTWRPFQPVPGGVRAVEAVDTSAPRLLLSGRGVVGGSINLPPEMASLAIWLANREESFGPQDLYALELPAPVRRATLQLLRVLCQRGVLRAEAAALEGIANFYGLGAD